MNDQDLERDLRTQVGPREQGYAAARLPLNLEDAATSRWRSSRMPRVLMLGGAGVAGALAVAILAGAFGGHGLGVGSSSPSAAATAPTLGVCGASDVSMTAEPWGGAAGSRGTVVSVVLAAGHDACMLGKGLTAQVVDANGSLLVTTSPSAPGDSVSLPNGASFTIGIAWSNWCAAAPTAPVSLELRMSGWQSFAPVTVPSGGADPIPPCLGSSQPSVLSWTGLEPQQ